MSSRTSWEQLLLHTNRLYGSLYFLTGAVWINGDELLRVSGMPAAELRTCLLWISAVDPQGPLVVPTEISARSRTQLVRDSLGRPQKTVEGFTIAIAPIALFQSSEMSLKRTAKLESSLVRKTSAYHSAVTLFELPPTSASSVHEPSHPEDAMADGSPRRSKRIKLETTAGIIGSSTAQNNEPALSCSATESTESKQEAAHGVASTSRHASEGETTQGGSRKRPRDARSPHKKSSAKVVATQSGALSPPARWEEAYERIKEVRSNITAPVDTMGAGAAQAGESVPKVRTPPNTLRMYYFH